MCGLMLFLLSFPVTRGLARHAYCGIIILVLFLCHHLLNPHWHKRVAKGRWPKRRLFALGVDLLLLLVSLAMLISCCFLAGEIFTFASFPMTWWARSLHSTSAAWLFVLVAIHLGERSTGIWKWGEKIFGSLWILVAMILFCTGIVCLARSGLWKILLVLDNARYFQESVGQFLLQYLSMGLGCCLAPHLLRKGMQV